MCNLSAYTVNKCAKTTSDTYIYLDTKFILCYVFVFQQCNYLMGMYTKKLGVTAIVLNALNVLHRNIQFNIICQVLVLVNDMYVKIN